MPLVLYVFGDKKQYTANVKLMMTLEKKSGDHQGHQESYSGDHEYISHIQSNPSDLTLMIPKVKVLVWLEICSPGYRSQAEREKKSKTGKKKQQHSIS